jgi:hypothetical protein
MTMKVDMLYDGQKVTWQRNGVFRATSGFPGYQARHFQCFTDKGPIPEGQYSVSLKEDRQPAVDDGTHMCQLAPSNLIQSIPRGAAAGVCEDTWVNWGQHRVGLIPVDPQTERACSPRRGGFYIHDSTKGYTHGCIEIESRFFVALRAYRSAIDRRLMPPRPRLFLKVQYFFDGTNGGTKLP